MLLLRQPLISLSSLGFGHGGANVLESQRFVYLFEEVLLFVIWKLLFDKVRWNSHWLWRRIDHMWQIESLVIVNDWRLHRLSRLLNSTNRLISICLISRTSWLLYVNAIQQPLLISFLLHQVSSCWSLDAALFFLIISKVEVALQLMKTGWL